MSNLFLNENWDIELTDHGTLKTVENAYAIAQKVANEVRLFKQDAYFNQLSGIAHFNIDLGHLPSEALLAQKIREKACNVAGVTEATVVFTSLVNRKLAGYITLKLTSGDIFNVEI